MSIRLDWKNLVLRLFATKEDAQHAAGRNKTPVLHERELGWVLRDNANGQLFDAGGKIPQQ